MKGKLNAGAWGGEGVGRVVSDPQPSNWLFCAVGLGDLTFPQVPTWGSLARTGRPFGVTLFMRPATCWVAHRPSLALPCLHIHPLAQGTSQAPAASLRAPEALRRHHESPATPRMLILRLGGRDPFQAPAVPLPSRGFRAKPSTLLYSRVG